MHRFISLILVVVLFLSVMIGCTPGKQGDDTKSKDTTGIVDTEPDKTETETETIDIKAEKTEYYRNLLETKAVKITEGIVSAEMSSDANVMKTIAGKDIMEFAINDNSVFLASKDETLYLRLKAGEQVKWSKAPDDGATNVQEAGESVGGGNVDSILSGKIKSVEYLETKDCQVGSKTVLSDYISVVFEIEKEEESKIVDNEEYIDEDVDVDAEISDSDEEDISDTESEVNVDETKTTKEEVQCIIAFSAETSELVYMQYEQKESESSPAIQMQLYFGVEYAVEYPDEAEIEEVSADDLRDAFSMQMFALLFGTIGQPDAEEDPDAEAD